jgi:hypothetical protein
LLTEKEKALVKGKNNLLAAIDFGVLAEADVVALTFHGVMKLSIQGGVPEHSLHWCFKLLSRLRFVGAVAGVRSS